MKHLTHETKRRRSFCLNLSSVQTPVPNTADLALLGMTASTKHTMPFLSIQNNTPVTDKLVFTIQHEKYTQNPAQLQLFWSRKIHVTWIISTQTHISLFKTEACVLLRLDGWVNCSRLNRYSIYTNTQDPWTLKDKHKYTGAVHLGHRCVCAVRETTTRRTVRDLSWHRCFKKIYILLNTSVIYNFTN